MSTTQPAQATTQKSIHIQLTEAQKKEILQFIHDTGGNAGLDIGVTFHVDVHTGTVAPSTFLVGNAV